MIGPLLLQLRQLFRHILEAGEGVEAPGAVGLRDPLGQRRGDDGLDQTGILRQSAPLRPMLQKIVQQQNAGAVAGDGDIAAAAVPYHHAHPVGIRVGANDNIGVFPLGQLDGHGKAPGILRVGADDRGEGPVWPELLRHGDKVLQAAGLHDPGRDKAAHAVEGGIDDLEGGILPQQGGVDGALQDGVDIQPVKILLQPGEGRRRGTFRPGRKRIDLRHLRRHQRRLLRRQLGAAVPVDLIAVIFLGVVAGSHIDACRRAEMPHRKAQLGRRAALAEHPHRDAAAAKGVCRFLREKAGIDPAVVADAHALLRHAAAQDDPGKGQRGLTDDIFIHAVKAHAHEPAETGRAELQRPVKAIPDLALIRQAAKLLPLLGGERRGLRPAKIFRAAIRHKNAPFCSEKINTDYNCLL